MQIYNSDNSLEISGESTDVSVKDISDSLFQDHVVTVNGKEYNVPGVKSAVDVYIKNSSDSEISFRFKLRDPDNNDEYYGDIIDLANGKEWSSNGLFILDILVTNEALTAKTIEVMLIGRG